MDVGHNGWKTDGCRAKVRLNRLDRGRCPNFDAVLVLDEIGIAVQERGPFASREILPAYRGSDSRKGAGQTG